LAPEPNALAVSADGATLYVGLDGSGEVARFALPAATPAGRARLAVDPFLRRSRADNMVNPPKRLVQGPSGQIGVSYIPLATAPSIRLFTSAQLP
jgi:hypothetical protein